MQNRNVRSIDVSHATNPFDIAANPQWFHTRSLRTLAWAALKADRGQTVHQHRLQVMNIAQPSSPTT
ncbi:hypothetical protein DS901_13400 [Loktanella sp. D2R18]|uniref:hypothetical protein n=1 Tax=Rhodobacterales TaxID=204455 RepID=UPI000DE90814|nr:MULTISPECIES: hypothetical protein [Rhodobacterales]MDO6591734.1 hypothetical protein [Yoonia sp. 1_MG-2023]RBW42554.1 hypothetical protein DS901_13400 [Loktanella sp. D2R18]